MVEKLTATERAVAAMVAEGAGNKQIARALHCGEQRVKNALTTAYRVLDLDPQCNRRVMLAVMVLRQKGDADAH